jgi:hypothetical protein
MISEFQIRRQRLRNQLQEGPVTVTFIKKSTGLSRTMRCTTNKGLIPTEHHPKPPVVVHVVHESNFDTMEVLESEIIITDEHLVKVYDLEAKGWRSFRWETITNVDAAGY